MCKENWIIVRGNTAYTGKISAHDWTESQHELRAIASARGFRLTVMRQVTTKIPLHDIRRLIPNLYMEMDKQCPVAMLKRYGAIHCMIKVPENQNNPVSQKCVTGEKDINTIP